MRRWMGKLLGLGYTITGKDRYDSFRLERVLGMPIVVMPSVANPKLLRTGAFFASQIDARLFRAESSVLDMGTGSGVCALFAARLARRVVAVDINPAAVRCAGINAMLNHLEARIDLRQGDLFAPVADERFDVVLFNPPFLIGVPRRRSGRGLAIERCRAAIRGRARRSPQPRRLGVAAAVVVRRCLCSVRDGATLARLPVGGVCAAPLHQRNADHPARRYPARVSAARSSPSDQSDDHVAATRSISAVDHDDGGGARR